MSLVQYSCMSQLLFVAKIVLSWWTLTSLSSSQQLCFGLAPCPTSDETCLDRNKLMDDHSNAAKTSDPGIHDNNIPSWEELDKRAVPTWYDEAKFGIFIHWGVFSVPAYRSEWFWRYWELEKQKDYIDFVSKTEKPGFTYTEYASRFTAEFYDPKQWADIFTQSGAQYIVLTSKHHDGYCMWNSTSIQSTWNWNAIDVGPHRDLLGDLAKEVKKSISPFTNKSLRFGLYHSLYEWFNPMYLSDKANNYSTQQFVDNKILPELYDLVDKYQPELIWSDGEWEASSEYWKAREFLNWYTTNSSVSSTAIYNDRWGIDVTCQHGSFLTCLDRYNPDKLQQHKYENAFTIDSTTWGYSRYSNYSDYMTVAQLIHTIIKTVAYNGNVLVNIGPAADGTIHPIFVDRLLGIGDWLKVNGEAIYESKPWSICQNETASNVYYTTKNNILYVHIIKWPHDNIVHLNCPIIISDQTTIRFVGLKSNTSKLEWKQSQLTGSVQKQKLHIQQSDATTTFQDNEIDGLFDIILPILSPSDIPCQHAWVIAISDVTNILHAVALVE